MSKVTQALSDVSEKPKILPSGRRTTCSFCGRGSDVAGAMVEGPGDVYICGDCVEIAYGIILQQRARHRIWPEENGPADGS